MKLLCFIKMKILTVKDFKNKCNLRKATMIESALQTLQRVYKYRIYPTDSRFYSDRGVVNIDNGSMGVLIGLVL